MIKEIKYYLKIQLEKITDYYEAGVREIEPFKRSELCLIENISNTLDLFAKDSNRFISKKRKRKEKQFKRKDKCNLKIILEQIVDHDSAIVYIPVFKKAEFCIIKNVNDTLNLFSKDLEKFITDKLIEMEKINEYKEM